MKVRKSIFGSKSEAKAFQQLLSRWSPRLSLYPSLPLANLFEIESRELKPKEWQFYLKTSVDYTFCESDGQPILSVEFDGLGGGFSKGPEYVQERETPDPYRKLKLDLKLRLASQVGYSLLVISADETEPVSSDECLTILDGIVGSLLSFRDTQYRLDKIAEEQKNELEGMPSHVAAEVFQDLVLQAEMVAEFENNPFVKEGWLYQEMCIRAGSDCRHEAQWLKDSHLNRVGCRVIVHTHKVSVVRTVWMRNIEVAGISPAAITNNIAEYLAFKQASKILLGRS